MKHLTKSEVAPKLKAGDLIEYRDSRGFRQNVIVVAAYKKFIYQFFGPRITYNELKSYMSNPDFKITSN